MLLHTLFLWFLALATVPRRPATLASEMGTRWRRGGLTHH